MNGPGSEGTVRVPLERPGAVIPSCSRQSQTGGSGESRFGIIQTISGNNIVKVARHHIFPEPGATETDA